MFLNATFQRGGHLIERLRKLSDFARFIFKAGASAEIAGTKSLHGFEKNLNLSQNETFTAEPRRNQCQQADGESDPRELNESQQRHAGSDGQKDHPDKANSQAVKSGFPFQVIQSNGDLDAEAEPN
jgi:hypothetical protein